MGGGTPKRDTEQTRKVTRMIDRTTRDTARDQTKKKEGGAHNGTASDQKGER